MGGRLVSGGLLLLLKRFTHTHVSHQRHCHAQRVVARKTRRPAAPAPFPAPPAIFLSYNHAPGPFSAIATRSVWWRANTASSCTGTISCSCCYLSVLQPCTWPIQRHCHAQRVVARERGIQLLRHHRPLQAPRRRVQAVVVGRGAACTWNRQGSICLPAVSAAQGTGGGAGACLLCLMHREQAGSRCAEGTCLPPARMHSPRACMTRHAGSQSRPLQPVGSCASRAP